ncbi:hypothetical protein Y883_21490, partial [Luteibacter rhizovicinus DSM 16549]
GGTMSRIAFMGLANGGGPMAANLLKAGHTLHVFDLSAEAVAQAVTHGATAANTAIVLQSITSAPSAMCRSSPASPRYSPSTWRLAGSMEITTSASCT